MRLFLSLEVRIMSRFILLAALAGVGLLLGYTGTKPSNPPVVASDNPAEFAISGPYTHENLSIFLLHGPDTLPPRNVLTLDEALAQGKAIVHETGTVNTLCVENLSDDSDLMMQNGDIVKGGRQDRVLRVAMILPPKSGPVAVESFCVEQGRWTNRGSESAAKFGTNPGQISGKDLKMAVNVGGVQGEVWKNVAVTQTALTVNNGTSVTMNASPTSLQLATENKELQAKLAAYRGPLSNILDGKTGVVGYAIAVNGKVTGAEVYGSSVLMAKAWKKAIDSAALEAFAEKKPAEFAVCRKDNVRMFLADAGGSKEMASNNSEFTIDASLPDFGGRSGTTTNRMLLAHGGINPSVPASISTLPGGGGPGRIDEARLRQYGQAWGRMTPEARTTAIQEITRDLPARYHPMVNDYFAALNRSHSGGTNSTSNSTGTLTLIGNNTYNGSTIHHPDPMNSTVTNLATSGIVINAGTLNITSQTSNINTNALESLSGNQFNSYQIGLRADIPQGFRQGNNASTVQASPVQAPPVQVNRVMGTNGVLVESRDRANPGVIIHRTFIAK
jgi:hypothetical protein